MDASGIEAVTFDFFDTLVFHREGRGRAAAVMDYLRTHRLESASWRHGILYEIFAGQHTDYSPDAPEEERQHYHVRLARRLFQKLGVAVPAADAARHAEPLWRLLGPACFEVFPDALPAIRTLRSAGYRLAIISNWPCGLTHFCTELGLSAYFDHVLASGEIGAAKPDGRIFAEACRRLRVHPARVLHVGDSLTDDYMGGDASGLRVVLIDRNAKREPRPERVIHSLGELTRKLQSPRTSS